MPYTIPPMPGIRFDHIAIGVPRMADASAVLVGVLGGTPHHGGRVAAYRFGQWQFQGGGRLEILEPAGGDGFLHRFLRARGPGIHHVTFQVPSLREACDRARARGYDIVGYDDSDPGWRQAFLHPKQALGIVVQFAESHGRSDEGTLRRWQAPPGPPDPPPPVRILGLRMRVRSAGRARTQWEEVLRGEGIETADGTLVYRWPDSPLCLVVELDPARDEGPVAIEIETERPVGLSDGPHPVLGATFVRRDRRSGPGPGEEISLPR